jgi:hypothetical protein
VDTTPALICCCHLHRQQTINQFSQAPQALSQAPKRYVVT